jgi:hypothetical protein
LVFSFLDFASMLLRGLHWLTEADARRLWDAPEQCRPGT